MTKKTKFGSPAVTIGDFFKNFSKLLMVLIGLFGCEDGLRTSARNDVSDVDIAGFLKQHFQPIADDNINLRDREFGLLNGKRQRIRDYEGKVLLLNFWATWCYPCKKEMPQMEELHQIMKGEEFRILAVNYGESKKKVTTFIEKNSYSFDVVLDRHKTISSEFNITGLPTTYLIDRGGKPLGMVLGPKEWNADSFLEFFKTISRNQL